MNHRPGEMMVKYDELATTLVRTAIERCVERDLASHGDLCAATHALACPDAEVWSERPDVALALYMAEPQKLNNALSEALADSTAANVVHIVALADAPLAVRFN